MAGTINIQWLSDSVINNVPKAFKVDIGGDADLTRTVIFDGSLYLPNYFKLMRIQYELNGFYAQLLWEGDTALNDRQLVTCAEDHSDDQCFYDHIGGIPNNAVNKTGNILLTTIGLVSGDAGYIILWLAPAEGVRPR